ncbi:glycoside hydrolase domain-containing protein [Spongiimicrobium sp. 3-5]|uniref:glycoside hydrolase domain-containing protein n=1 Tax=Spongiimicrobium sp. 3-5 TaxID=3332596 RepID=UPI00397EE052
MKIKPAIVLLFLCSFFILTDCSDAPEKKITEIGMDNSVYVDPFIATSDDHGQTDVAAAPPFGMVKPAPDTHPIAHSGYDYKAQKTTGFSNTRFSGVGCHGVGGHIRVLPFVVNQDTIIPTEIGLNKASEIARPGYYAVGLDNNIKVALSATNQIAYHKYTFPKSDRSGLTVNLASSFAEFNYEKHKVSKEGYITGELSGANVCNMGQYKFYFAIATNKAHTLVSDTTSVVTFTFSTVAAEEVLFYCSLSTISPENALVKLVEGKKASFEEVKKSAASKWRELLNTVEVAGNDPSLKRTFYTSLYHTLQSPFLINEQDGSYRGSDGKTYNTQQRLHYHGWSVWDTFRTKLPLISFLFPDKYSHMVQSISALYKQGKANWATDHEPFITVRTEHSVVVLLEALQKDLLPYNIADLYSHLQDEAQALPFETPDNILESSLDLWALSEIAKTLGKEEDYKKYRQQAFDYKKIWKKKFMIMDDKSDIMHGDGLYEGTLWQYRWFVPFDIEGIQDLMGGKDSFEEQLDYFFDEELFNIGNQPDIQVPYLYAYTNAAWKTQLRVNAILLDTTNNWYGTHKKLKKPMRRKIFQDTPDGFLKEMDDDAGTMSAWYVWSAMGLYPVFPGSTNMVIGRPIFPKITLHLKEGDLEIRTKNFSDSARFIQEVTFNGVTNNSPFIDFNDLVKGGILEIQLGNQPNKDWGTLN